MMFARRELFRRALGAGVAAATIKPSDIMAEATKLGGVGQIGQIGGLREDTVCDEGYNVNTWNVMDRLEEESRWSREEAKFMDQDIQNKVSWSPAYKSIIHTQRMREVRELRKALDKNEDLLKKAVKMLGM